MLKKVKTKAKHIIKLYKFRPLANEKDCERLKGILETGEFWCSKFSELNDPMEGVYLFLNYPNNRSELIDLIFKTKTSYKICSFCNEQAFANPLMWGYYANGFRGVAIEIKVSSDKVKKIKYVSKIHSFTGKNPTKEAEKILTTKLSPWKHECEYRFLEKRENNKSKIGKITALYFGDPYERTRNRTDIIENNDAVRKYIVLKNKILEITKELGVHSVKIENCKVIKKEIP